MFGVIVGIVAAAGFAVYVYLGRERLGAAGVGMAAVRTGALSAIIVLLANPSGERTGRGIPPTVLLDASRSLGAAGGKWRTALDTARSLAGSDGVILRIGDAVTRYDSGPPTAARSHTEDGLRVAAGRGGPVYLVTDGELTDYDALPPSLREHVTVILLPRDTVPDAAILEVAVPPRVRVEDSIPVTLEVGAWGALAADSGTVEIRVGERLVVRRRVALPPPPGVGRRTLRVPAGTLPAGDHVLDIALAVVDDAEPADNRRQRIVTVSTLPAIVLVARPPDWEARFLLSTLRDLTQSTIQGFAEIATGRWLNMQTGEPVAEAEVRRAVRAAALLVVRGDWSGTAGRQPRWVWPRAGSRLMQGDWYPTQPVPASPLAGALGLVSWDSLPPLTGIVPLALGQDEWVAVQSRLGRRGAERPILVGRDSARVRMLTMAGSGAWRWLLRGGAAAEAYRTMVAAGVDWLLAASGAGGGVLTATPVVASGMPVVFRRRAAAFDSVRVSFTGPDSSFAVVLTFGEQDQAAVTLPVGVYRWQARGATASGTVVVEPYSAEIPPGPVTVGAVEAGLRIATLLRNAREYGWLFGLALALLVAEWAWRTRRGLP